MKLHPKLDPFQKNYTKFHRGLCGLAIAGILVAGCHVKSPADLSNLRDSFLLTSQPESATNLAQAKNDLGMQAQVTIMGWVDLNAFPSESNKAVVLVREILDDTDHGGKNHDPSSCPFCKRRMEAAPKAAVVFTDETGTPLSHKFQTIFPVQQGDTVIVTGSATLDPKLDIFKITASGIYLNPK